MKIPMAYELQDCARKANAAIAASYKLSMNEQRILLAVLAQVRNDEFVTDQKMYFVTAKDIVAPGDSSGNEFRALKEACNSLFERVVTIDGVPNGASKLRTAGPLRTRWIQSEAVYLHGKGKIGLRLAHDILPYINQLRSDFSRIPTKPIISMTSAHAVRVFEMLMQFRDTGICKISVAELRNRMGLIDEYKKFSDFKRRVIDIAVKQINESAGIHVDVEYIRNGKTVETLNFRFTRDVIKTLENKKKGEPDSGNANSENGSARVSDAMQKAMELMIQNKYENVSEERIIKIMNMYKTDSPINAVTMLIAKDEAIRD